MRKKILIIGITLVVLAGGIVILLLNLGGLVNRNKEFLISRAEDVLGREVTVGEIGVTLRGGIGVRLQDLTIADDPAFSSGPFLEAADLQVNARLLPLLKKEFEVKRVILRDPVIRLIRNRQGLLNVSTLAVGDGGAAASPSSPSGSQRSSPAAFVVSLVNLDGGEVSFEDQAQGLKLKITDIRSKVTDIDLNQPISLTLEAAFLSDDRNLAVQATFGPVGGSMDDMPVEATITLDPVEFERAAEVLPQLRSSLPDSFAVSGPVTLRVDLSGTAAAPRIKVELDATEATLRAATGFLKAEGVPLTFSADLRTDEDTYVITDMELALHTLTMTGAGEVTAGDAPLLKLDLRSGPTSLAGWSSVLPALEPYQLSGNVQFSARIDGRIQQGKPPPVTGTATVRDVTARLPQQPKPLRDIQASISFTERDAKITNASLLVGGSRIDGSATIVRFEPLTVDYRATSSRLAMLDVKPPNPAAKKPEVMENLILQGRMRAGTKVINRGRVSSSSGSVANFDYNDLSGRYSIEGDVIDLSDINVQTLDGSLKGSGRILMDEQSPSFSFDTEARDLNLTQVFELLPGVVRKHLRGKANLNLKITGSGKDWNSIQKTIAGDGLAELFAGEIVGTNIVSDIFDIVDQLSNITGQSDWVAQNVRDKYPKVFKNANTSFEDFKSTFVIENGKLLARNIRLDAGDYLMLGKGAIDLNGGLDLAVTLTISQGLSADLVSGFSTASLLQNNQGQIEIPFLLTGTLPKVSVKPAPDFVQKILQKALLEKGLDLFGKEGSSLDDLKKEGLKKFLDFGKKKKKPAAPADTTSAP